MNQVTGEQIQAALHTAGLVAQEQPEAIAAGLRALLEAAQPAFDVLAFDTEPSHFRALLNGVTP